MRGLSCRTVDYKIRSRKARCRAGALAIAIGAFVQIAFVQAAAADELQPFRNVGDGYRAVKVITSYDLHPETKTMDIVAKEPNDPSFSRDVLRESGGAHRS